MANEFKVKKGLIVHGSGSTVLDIQGSQGQLFSITDDLTGTLFAVSDISGVPIFDVNADGTTTLDGNLNLGDNNKLQLGASQDLKIYHDGSNSYIEESGTGRLILSGGSDIQLQSPAGELMGDFTGNGSVDLYYNNSKKFETTETGVSVTGELEATTLDINGNADISGVLNSSTIVIDDTAGTRGIFRNNAAYDLRLGGGTVFSDGAYISLSGGTRGGGTTNTKGRVEIFSGGSNYSAQAEITGDIVIGTQWNGGTSNILVLDSSTNNVTFAGDINVNSNHIGRDDDNYIGFETDNQIKFRVNGATQVKLIAVSYTHLTLPTTPYV